MHQHLRRRSKCERKWSSKWRRIVDSSKCYTSTLCLTKKSRPALSEEANCGAHMQGLKGLTGVCEGTNSGFFCRRLLWPSQSCLAPLHMQLKNYFFHVTNCSSGIILVCWTSGNNVFHLVTFSVPPLKYSVINFVLERNSIPHWSRVRDTNCLRGI